MDLSEFPGQPGLHRETLSQNKMNKTTTKEKKKGKVSIEHDNMIIISVHPKTNVSITDIYIRNHGVVF